MQSSRDWANLALRIGVAFSFLYPPINAIWNPYSWIGYFPSFMPNILPDEVMLHAFGVIEVIIALWLLSGWRIFWPSVASAAILIAIVVFNIPNFEVLFRDLSIAAMSVALAIMSYPKRIVGEMREASADR